jgi:hypothetical protein
MLGYFVLENEIGCTPVGRVQPALSVVVGVGVAVGAGVAVGVGATVGTGVAVASEPAEPARPASGTGRGSDSRSIFTQLRDRPLLPRPGQQRHVVGGTAGKHERGTNKTKESWWRPAQADPAGEQSPGGIEEGRPAPQCVA